MQRSVLELLHDIWTKKKTHLIKNLIKQSYFWTILATPILIYYKYKTITYIHVLEILGIELGKPEIDQNLTRILSDVFASDSGFIKYFPIYITKQVGQDREIGLRLLTAWRLFLLYMAKHQSGLISDNVKTALLGITQDAMRFFIRFRKHSIPFTHCSQLYLSLISYWPEASYRDGSFNEWVDFMTIISDSCYTRAGNKCREVILAIAIKLVEHYEEVFRVESRGAEKFLLAMMEIIEVQYDITIFLKRSDIVLEDDYISWGLVTKFTGMFFSFENRYKWIYYTQMLQKTLSIVGYLASHEELMPLAQLSLQFLINYINSPMYRDFGTENVQDFYDSIKFPKYLFDCTPLEILGSNTKPYEQFWLTYTCLMNLNLTITQRFHDIVMHSMIDYLDQHKKEICQIFKLPSVTRHKCALKCVSNTMLMCTFMLRWRVSIYSFEDTIIPKYYKLISECLLASVTIMLRPEIKRRSSIRSTSADIYFAERLPAEFLVDITERLAEILGASCLGLLNISPDLLHTFQSGDFTAAKHWDVQYEFPIPFIMTPTKTLWLTFEHILRMAHFLCITLNKRLYLRPSFRSWVCLVHYNRRRASSSLIYRDFDYYEKKISHRNNR